MERTLQFRFLLDENVSKASGIRLRMQGHDVIRIGSDIKIADDEDILAFSKEQQRILVTHDQDFGNLIFEKRMSIGEGVVLFRYESSDPEDVAKRMARIIGSGVFQFHLRFTTVDEHKVRQREV